MSISRELREQFIHSKNTTTDSSLVAEALGLARQDLEEVIVSDISAMIKRDYRRALEGYIFCISRILDHTKSWEYITKAFISCNEKVPERYHQQFGRNLPDNIQNKKAS